MLSNNNNDTQTIEWSNVGSVDKFIQNQPTIQVTFVINQNDLEKSTFFVDFDRRLWVSKEEWDEIEKKSKLVSMVDAFKGMLNSLMINPELDKLK